MSDAGTLGKAAVCNMHGAVDMQHGSLERYQSSEAFQPSCRAAMFAVLSIS